MKRNPLNDDAYDGNDEQIDDLKTAVRRLMDIGLRAVQRDVHLADEMDTLLEELGLNEPESEDEAA